MHGKNIDFYCLTIPSVVIIIAYKQNSFMLHSDLSYFPVMMSRHSLTTLMLGQRNSSFRKETHCK